jgi:Fe-S-cluster containining protein
MTFWRKKYMLLNPCLTCGACCAFYRASFYWAEADEFSQGGVPIELTEKLNPYLLVMKGTTRSAPRCVALEGSIGHDVFCGIYERRSSVCREFEPSWEKNEPNPRCDKARLAWGLAPLTPGSWLETPPFNIEKPAVDELVNVNMNAGIFDRHEEIIQCILPDVVEKRIGDISDLLAQEQESLPA